MADIDRRLERFVRVSFTLTVKTGLRVGAQDSTIAIGGQENSIVRDPLTGQPYIPGSSIKGKMRSLIERSRGLDQNQPIQQPRVFMHVCKTEEAYEACLTCQLFGTPAPERERWFCQSRLRFSDLFLTTESERRLRETTTDLPYTEVKSEAAIDRMTSAAVPRTMERVPAGAEFGPGSIGIFLYAGDDAEAYLGQLLTGLTLLEADYLGGGGARGSGRVEFADLGLSRLTFGPDVTVSADFDSRFARLDEFGAAVSAISAWVAA